MQHVDVGELPTLTSATRNVNGNARQRSELWAVVKKYTGDPKLVDWAARLIRTNDVPARDEVALARAVQLYVQQHIKYFREYPERFASPLRTLQWGIGDCDDMTILVASTLRGFRIPVRAVFIRFTYKKPDGTMKRVSHVYPEACLRGRWVALETVHPWPMGDSAEQRARKKGYNPRVEIIGP